ncbi:hypothetical protein C8Q78DRAFT_434848 [Trametes maxima]|nr:hypothetical protein C8Q78DRAFT_434848 [Trametes maxima]
MDTSQPRSPISDAGSTTSSTLEDTQRHLEETRAHVEASRSTGTAVLNRAGKVYNTAQTAFATGQNVISVVQPIYESDAAKVVRESVTAFVEGLPGVLKALDQVANIHPFIKVAVGAFRVVVELDVKRRDNEKKITILFVAMKDMMEVLLRLREIDAAGTTPDGQTAKTRLQKLVTDTAGDIKDCANACDTYSKKKLLTKVFNSSSWDDKFKGFLTLFTERRKAFSFELELYVGKGMNDANRKLDGVDEKLNVILQIFSSLVPPEQQELGEIIRNKKGREVVMKDDKVLLSLMKFKASSGAGAARGATPQTETKMDLKDDTDLKSLKEELIESADMAMQKNWDTFARKFDQQQKRLVEEMKGFVQHQSDRVIRSVLSGPHDLIKDQDIHKLWAYMGWRGHVKARHFILALRDAYLQPPPEETADVHSSDPSKPTVITLNMANEDKWAVNYIDFNSISAITEAFDDDASGFITISEVNQFTSSRPEGWSLLHWLAYWAIGWQMTSTNYVLKINALFDEMFALLPHIRPENHRFAYEYLDAVWEPVTTYTSSLEMVYLEDELWARFESQVYSEERRLEEVWKSFRYNIDALDTVSLITGPGRIEKFLFPLLYLMLRRDLEIFRLAHRKIVIGEGELEASAYNIRRVLYHAESRMGVLKGLFKQRNLDPGEQFRTFACGLYNYAFDPSQIWVFKTQVEQPYHRPLPVENFVNEAEDSDSIPTDLSILTCPPPAESLFTMPAQDVLTEHDQNAPDSIRHVLGRWYGFYGKDELWPAYSMSTFFLHTVSGETFEAQSVSPAGTAYSISGERIVNDAGEEEFDMLLVYSFDFETRFLKGTLSEDGLSMSGVWGFSKEDMHDDFHFTRLSPDVLAARPAPKEFREDRLGALWNFALAAARREVRRRTPRLRWYSTIDLLRKRDQFIALDGLETTIGLTPDEYKAYSALDHELTFEEARSCFALIEMRARASSQVGYFCDFCRGSIEGARYTCIPCTIEGNVSIDLCDKPECRNARLKTVSIEHSALHDMIKIRRLIIYRRDLPWLLWRGQEMIEDARDLYEKSTRTERDAIVGHSAVPQGGDEEIQSPVVPNGGLSGINADAGSVHEDNRTNADAAISNAPIATFHEESGIGDSEDCTATVPSEDMSDAGSEHDTEGGHLQKNEQTVARGRIRLGGRASAVNKGTTRLACAACSQAVTRPFFVCIDCKDREYEDIYLCDGCDARPVGAHDASHTLARCTPPEADGPSDDAPGPGVSEERFRALESQVAAYASQFAALGERIQGLERLLGSVLAKLDPQAALGL